jgi:hypothetical protein
VLALARDLFRGGLAGLIVGVIAFGIGGRVVMRISALLNPEREGVLTENGNVIGEITLDGTLELIFFAGVFGGMLAGFVWVIVREWLPSDPSQRVSTAALAAVCLGSFAVLTEGARDFQVLSPAWLHLTMFLLLIALAGAVIALADPVLDGLLPHGRLAGWVYGILALPIGLMALSVLLQALLTERILLWLLAAGIILILIASLVAWWGRYLGGPAPSWLRPAARASLIMACLFGVLHFAIEAEEILRLASSGA